MDGIIFLIFCFLMLYIMNLADKRYKCYQVNEDLIRENIELKKRLKEMGE